MKKALLALAAAALALAVLVELRRREEIAAHPAADEEEPLHLWGPGSDRRPTHYTEG